MKRLVLAIVFLCLLVPSGDALRVQVSGTDIAVKGAWHDVRAYGAKGDGTTDDTAAIQAAIDAAETAGGGIAFFPLGTYIVGSRIEIKANVKIVGVGMDSTKITCLDATAVYSFMMYGVNVDDWEVSDLTIDGNISSRPVAAINTSGIFINGGSNARISRVRFTDLGDKDSPGGANIYFAAWDDGDGLRPADMTADDASANIIKDCQFLDANYQTSFGVRLLTNWEYNIAAGSFVQFNEHNVIDNNYFEGFNWNAVELAGPACRYNTVSNNTFKSVRGTAFEADKGASYNTFTGNVVEGTTENTNNDCVPIRIQGDVGGAYPERLAVGNTLVGNAIHNTLYASNIAVAIQLQYAHDTVVANNTIDDVNAAAITGYGIRLLREIDGLVIEGNVITSVYTGVFGYTTPGAGDDLVDIIISENFIESTRNGIELGAASGAYYRRINISNNKLISPAVGDSNRGIICSAQISDVMINGNSVDEYKYGIQLTTDGQISNNYIRGSTIDGIRLDAGITTSTVVFNNVIEESSGDKIDLVGGTPLVIALDNDNRGVNIDGVLVLGPGTKHDGLVIHPAAELQTTTVDQQTLDSFTLVDNNIYLVTVKIAAFENGVNRAGYEIKVVVYRDGGGATLQGAVVSVITSESEAAWDATFTVNSNDLRVSVTGEAATTIEWSCTLSYMNVGD